MIGHRETVGRPALYATTRQFLDDLGVVSLADLPTMKASLPKAGTSDQFELNVIETFDRKPAVDK